MTNYKSLSPLFIAVCCLLTLPAFSGDVAENNVAIDTGKKPIEIAQGRAVASPLQSCGANFGCDVSGLGADQQVLLDHEALLEELAATMQASVETN